MYGSSRKEGALIVDISATIETKIEALRHHRSQVDPGDGGWIREWAAGTGRAAGIAYAEGFRVVTLVSEPPAPAEPA